MFPRISLKHILFIIFTLIASLPVLILAVWVEQSALDKEISSVEEKHLLVARNLTGDLERYVIDVESSLQLVAINLIKNKPIEGIPEHLDSLYLGHIFITDNEARILKQVTAKSRSKVDQFSSQTLNTLLPLIKSAKANPAIVVYSDMARTNEDETLFYLVKAVEQDKFVIGALLTTHIVEAQKKVSFGRRGHAAIVDRTGRAIAHPVPDWVKTSKDMSFLPPVKSMMQGKTGVSKFFTPAMQADMVAGYTVVPHSGWGVMVPQPFEELEERAGDVQIIALTITLAGIGIAGLISWFVAGALSEPIYSVVHATELDSDASKSPLATEVMSPRKLIPHELRILLSSFTLMRVKINNLTLQLHSKIDLANAEVKSQNDLLQKQSLELQKSNFKLEKLTYIDALTELYNRRYFDETLEKELDYAKRQSDTFSLMVIDLDHFKYVNDEFGHTVGDAVLCGISKVISHNVRATDVVCRVGGEEFAIILRHTDVSQVNSTAELLRKKIEAWAIEQAGAQITITASIGTITNEASSNENYSAGDLYRFADLAMYHSKKNGRNQITQYADIAHIHNPVSKFNSQS